MIRFLTSSQAALFAAVLVQAALLLLSGASPVACGGAILIAALAMSGLTPLSGRKRLWPAVFLGVCVLLIASAWIWPNVAGRSMLDAVALKLVASLLVVESACLMLPARTQPHQFLLPLVTLGVAGAFYPLADSPETTVVPYVAVTAAVVVAWLAYSRQPSRHRSTLPASQRRPAKKESLHLRMWRYSIFAAIFTIVLASMQMVIGYTTVGIRAAQQVVSSQLRPGSSRNSRATSQFVHGGTLHSVLSAHQVKPAEVALRVFSRNRPGYLRGSAFDTFDKSKWSRRDGAAFFTHHKFALPLKTVPEGVPDTPMQHNLFAIQDLGAAKNWNTLKVANDARRLPLYFTPVDAHLVEGWGQKVMFDRNNVVRMGLWVARPYTIHSPVVPQPVELNATDRQILLTPCRGLEPEAVELARQVTRGKSTTMEKIQAVENFFSQEFRYSIAGFTTPPGRDQVSYFLLNRQPSHCEFFATGAAAMLRLAGVPCRYVTGYRVTELDEGHAEYWIGRNRNAHAWVEAYDSSAKQWRVVEATPGMALEEEIDPAARAAADAEFNKSTAERAGGLLAMCFRAVTSGAAGLSTLAFLTVFSCGIVWFANSKRLVMRRVWETKAEFAQRKRAVLLEEMDSRMRQAGLTRPPSETLHQFAARISQQAASDPALLAAAEWYQQYAINRYSATPAASPPIPALESRAVASGSA